MHDGHVSAKRSRERRCHAEDGHRSNCKSFRGCDNQNHGQQAGHHDAAPARGDLRVRGVRHAALFGSVARGTAGPGSDIDIMIDIEPETVRDIYAYVGLKDHIASLFAAPVDVVDRDALRPALRPPADADAVYAF